MGFSGFLRTGKASQRLPHKGQDCQTKNREGCCVKYRILAVILQEPWRDILFTHLVMECNKQLSYLTLAGSLWYIRSWNLTSSCSSDVQQASMSLSRICVQYLYHACTHTSIFTVTKSLKYKHVIYKFAQVYKFVYLLQEIKIYKETCKFQPFHLNCYRQSSTDKG